MRNSVAACCLAIAAAGWATATLAHHSISMVEISTPVWVKGTVVEFRAQHPHVMVKLDVQGKDGRPQQWDIEGPNLMRLERMGADKDFLKAGDVIEVCGFRLKQPYTRPAFIHGQVLVMPDGHMRLFGPYGKLTNCIRPADTAEKWAKFLKEDPLALPAWCNARVYVQVATVSPPAMIEAIDRQMEYPCH
jgi:hypothetical protein